MTGYNKWVRSVIGLLLLLFIGTMVVINFLTPDKTFSEAENRVLDSRPSFSLQSLLSGEFMKDYEQYVTDQFAFRNEWIGIKTDADRALGKKDSNGVYLGADGYLIQSFTSPQEADMEERIRAIHSFHQDTPDLRKYILLAPTAASVLQSKLPAYAPVGNQRAVLNQFRQKLERLGPDIRFIDVYPALYAKREEYIYYKTDHHWTTKGAYYAYQALGQEMGLTPKEEEYFNITKGADAFYGSLYSKSGFKHLNPDSISLYLPKSKEQVQVEYLGGEYKSTDSLYAMDHLHQKDKYDVFLNGNHSLVKITTGHEQERKLLVVKDSYANSFIPFLALHFSEIYVVDLRYYTDSLDTLIRENQIQDMLLLYNATTFFDDPFIKDLSE
ncbi:DHHW family protein [Salibacterium qingdaonense]|uniref:DHHW protein n=1 Tax=Salibacterium qingdaonense TaxID=266892 RepID=A0A1I4LUW0_9BACI|nr:DHHW family protein [Salibacterium qingdaonense]SFL94780.1 DHHW protein [Salibacterium qingdaonense]